MRTVERTDQEQHFSEGEPDLEPPEELAVGELDEETILEEDLDSEVLLEEDVDEDVLEETLEDLVHLDDEDDDSDVAAAPTGPGDVPVEVEEADDLDVEPLDIADVEESLDRILRERLAELSVEDDEDVAAAPDGPDVALAVVAPCRADEFVCRGCFLVRSRVQLADPPASLCRDCAA